MADRIERGVVDAALATGSTPAGALATADTARAERPAGVEVPAAPPAGGVPASPAVQVAERYRAPGRFGQRIEVSGAIDASTGNAVLHDLIHAAVTGEALLVDLSNVDDVDEAGLAILHTARRQSRMIGGDLVLTGVPERLERLLSDFTTEEDLQPR